GYRMKQAASNVQGGGASGMSSLILFSGPSIAETDSTDSGAGPMDSLIIGFNCPQLNNNSSTAGVTNPVNIVHRRGRSEMYLPNRPSSASRHLDRSNSKCLSDREVEMSKM
ncbi:hypothetical protein RUND412_004983, partial [Rhizina undulata]